MVSVIAAKFRAFLFPISKQASKQREETETEKEGMEMTAGNKNKADRQTDGRTDGRTTEKL